MAGHLGERPVVGDTGADGKPVGGSAGHFLASCYQILDTYLQRLSQALQGCPRRALGVATFYVEDARFLDTYHLGQALSG